MPKRLRLAWLAFRKPHLFGPAMSITKALINGSAESEATITYKDGTKQKIVIDYQVVTND